MADQQAQQSPSAEPRFFYGYAVVAIALCMMVAIWGVYFAFGVFFNPMLTEFGWSRAMTSGAFSLSMIVHGLLGFVTGGLTDRIGPRLVMTLCGFLLGLGYLLMSQISAVWQLYLFYGVIIGIGMSGAWVPLLSTVARWFAVRRSLMTGIVVTGNSIGLLIGPPVANWLISTYDWRTSYIIMGSIVLVLVVLGAQFLKRDPTKIGQVPYGEKEEGEQGLTAGTEGFSLRQAVCTRQFWMYFAMLLCFGYCLFAITVHVIPHAIDLGISAASAANVLAIVGGLTIVGNVLLGSAGDRIGSRQVFVIGFILMSAALFWLVPATEVWMLCLFAVVFGLGQGGCGVQESPMVAALFGLRSHGLVFGVVGIGFTLGATLGPLMAGYIFDATTSYQLAFLVSAAMGVIGLVLALLLGPGRYEHRKSKG